MSKFQKHSKADWLAKVTKDLKGRPLEELNFEAAGISLSPIHHREDTAGSSSITSRQDNSWEIGETILAHDVKTANAEGLHSLNNGANALYFHLGEQITAAEIPALLSDFQPEWISLHFDLANSTISVLELAKALASFANEHSYDTSKMHCSFKNHKLSFQEALGLISWLPKAKIFSIRKELINDDLSAEYLAELLYEANKILGQPNEENHSPRKRCELITFEITATDHYYLNIARVRALRLLWQNILAAWNIEHQGITQIEGHLKTDQSTDENTNKIRLGAQAIATVIGGVDRMYIGPSDAATNPEGNSFSKRISRNINHLLIEESHMAKVNDPAAGSYFLEHLTDVLAEKAWTIFQEKTKA